MEDLNEGLEVETIIPESAEIEVPAEEEDIEIPVIGDEPQPEEDEHEALPIAKKLRGVIKEKDRTLRETTTRLKELEAKVEAMTAPAPIEIPPVPDIEDFDFDKEAHSRAVEARARLVLKKEAEQAEERKAQEAANAAWQAKRDQYAAARTTTKLPAFEEAEAVAGSHLNQTQIGIIVAGTSAPERLIYALGRNEAELKRLAAITDPVTFAIEIGKTLGAMKTTKPKRTPPEPESPVRGGTPSGDQMKKYEVGGRFF